MTDCLSSDTGLPPCFITRYCILGGMSTSGGEREVFKLWAEQSFAHYIEDIEEHQDTEIANHARNIEEGLDYLRKKCDFSNAIRDH